MAKKIVKFCCLSWREQGLFIEAFCLTGMVRLAVLLLPFRWLAPILGKHMEDSSMREEAATMKAAMGLGWMVEAVSRYTPWESKCLVQAMVGKILLRQHRIANTLFLGVRRDEKNKLIAHSWLRCGEVIVTGGRGREQFTVVSKFADSRENSRCDERR